MMSKLKHLLPLFYILAFTFSLGFPLLSLHAQSNQKTLSIAIPEYMSSQFTQELFAPFDAAHAGVKVTIVKLGDESFYSSAAYDMEKHFESAQKYASRADVLYTNSYNLSIESTRAGYFLDLSPLIKGDSAFNSEDFATAAWQSFTWDGGQWAVPITYDLIFLSYDPTAFDKAGIAYPRDNWTFEEFADAARKLTVKDSDGKITRPGTLTWNPYALARILAGESFYDASTPLSTPDFDKPGVEKFVTLWSQLADEGVTGRDFRGDMNTVPLRIDQSYALAKGGLDGNPRKGALLPGGYAGISLEGFTVSAGTQYPELAYELLKFLSSDPKLSNVFFGYRPARKDVVLDTQDPNFQYRLKFSEDNQAFLDMAVEKALPVSEYRFVDYIFKAIGDMKEKKQDAKTALQSAQDAALRALQIAEAKRNEKSVVVATIVPTPVLKANEVALKFSLNAYITPVPNREQWDKAIADFTSSDPQVRHIELGMSMGGDPSDIYKNFDCWTVPGNMVANGGDVNKILALDPLMSADSTFDKHDFIGDSLTPFIKDSKAYAMPLYLQPQVLRYNSSLFDKAGIPEPTNQWTIDQFNDALKALKADAKAEPPFVPREYGGNYLLLLIAAYGGLPLDVRTDPATIQFTDPTNVDAIRQVLDLAKQGYIKYTKLSGNGGGGMGGPDTDPIYTYSLNLINYRRFSSPDTDKENVYKLVNYPRGTAYVPVAFDIGAGYISTSAAYPEGCYRWLSYLTNHPELFNAMPVRRSALNSETVKAQGEDVLRFYQEIDTLLQNSSTLIMSNSASSFGAYILQYVLFRAFDRYVLEDADLEAELKDAETFAQSYQECIKNIPPMSGGQNQTEMQAYYKQFTDCATKLDPSLQSIFGIN